LSVFHEQSYFMQKAQQPGNAELYKDLVNEETNEELMPALDKYFKARTTENLTEVVDGAIDSIYVLAGLLNSLIGPDKAQQCWNEVQNSNLSKIGPTGPIFREDGKILKAPGYFKPDLFSILANVK